MIHVAAALHTQKPAKRGDWHMLVHCTWLGSDGGDPALDDLNQPRHAASARAFLEDSVKRWVAWGAVQPVLAWSVKRSPTIEFEGCGLFGALAAQLLAAVSGTGWAVCSACGEMYDPGPRRPNPNRRNYCPDRRESGAPHRDASRDSRRRQAASKHKEHRQ
jgi:hypothetical protein